MLWQQFISHAFQSCLQSKHDYLVQFSWYSICLISRVDGFMIYLTFKLSNTITFWRTFNTNSYACACENECFVIERKYVLVGGVTYDKWQSNNESLRKEKFFIFHNFSWRNKNFCLWYQVYEKYLTVWKVRRKCFKFWKYFCCHKCKVLPISR